MFTLFISNKTDVGVVEDVLALPISDFTNSRIGYSKYSLQNKVKIKGIPKLDDANNAGTENGYEESSELGGFAPK